MESILPYLLLAVVAAVWIVAILFVYRWGPGEVHKRLECPHHQKMVELRVVYSEPEWGTLRASDVKACSIFGSGAVVCDKACLAQCEEQWLVASHGL